MSVKFQARRDRYHWCERAIFVTIISCVFGLGWGGGRGGDLARGKQHSMAFGNSFSFKGGNTWPGAI